QTCAVVTYRTLVRARSRAGEPTIMDAQRRADPCGGRVDDGSRCTGAERGVRAHRARHRVPDREPAAATLARRRRTRDRAQPVTRAAALPAMGRRVAEEVPAVPERAGRVPAAEREPAGARD